MSTPQASNEIKAQVKYLVDQLLEDLSEELWKSRFLPKGEYIKLVETERYEAFEALITEQREQAKREQAADDVDKMYAQIEKARQELAKEILAVGHNLDCMFCGFKDRIAHRQPHVEKESDDE